MDNYIYLFRSLEQLFIHSPTILINRMNEQKLKIPKLADNNLLTADN